MHLGMKVKLQLISYVSSCKYELNIHADRLEDLDLIVYNVPKVHNTVANPGPRVRYRSCSSQPHSVHSFGRYLNFSHTEIKPNIAKLKGDRTI